MIPGDYVSTVYAITYVVVFSGLLTSVTIGYLWFVKAPPVKPRGQLPLGLVSHDLADSFPSFPSASPMTAVEIAARAKPLVYSHAGSWQIATGRPPGELSHRRRDAADGR
jgi:hypothetical protein